ncbi:LppX_LprAFG lipoprotein [Protofrankia coriariae]|nr:LppX_LprAFG lipoprotein [Protofrankia coriariae]
MTISGPGATQSRFLYALHFFSFFRLFGRPSFFGFSHSGFSRSGFSRSDFSRAARVTASALALLAPGLLLAAAGCSSDDSPAPPPAIPTNVAPTEINGVPAPLAGAYQATINRGTARIRFSDQANFVSSSGRRQISITGTGTVDFVNSASQTVRDVAGGGRSELLIVGSDLYQRSVPPADVPNPPRWTRVVPGASGSRPATPAPTPTTQPTTGDALALRLGFLSGASAPATTVGQETIDGVTTTHYTLSVNLDTAATRGNISATTVEYYKNTLGTAIQPTEAWIDADGLIRQLRVTVATSSTDADTSAGRSEIVRTVTYSDFGVPPHITAPSPDQIAPG